MKIIEKIEIKYFRSFYGGVGSQKVGIVDLKDFNIFSGANDSGKSNVLRALNLFFTKEVFLGEEFSFLGHVNKGAQRYFKNKKKGPSFEISVLFNIGNAGRESILGERFWITKKYTSVTRNEPAAIAYECSQRGEKGQRIKKSRVDASVTRLLNKVEFFYVPAIKDRRYFQYLFKRLQNSLLTKDSSFSGFSEKFDKKLKEETKNIFDNFQEETGIGAEFKIPETLIDFYNNLTVSTDDDISLSDRGDGIQAKFIPEILDEISNDKKITIWGFEEPENSYEHRNAKRLADAFLNKYSERKQIFITTHATEFLSANDNERVSIYRVFKTAKGDSLIDRYDEGKGFDLNEIINGYWDGIEDSAKTERRKSVLEMILGDLGIIDDARIVQSLESQLSRLKNDLQRSGLQASLKKQALEQARKDFDRCISKLGDAERAIKRLQRPIVYVEDKICSLYKVAWLKLHGIDFDESSLDDVFEYNAPFEIHPKDGFGNMKAIGNEPISVEWKDRKRVLIFDFDDGGFSDGFKKLKDKHGWSEIFGEKETCLYRTRQAANLFAVAIPVPSFRSEYASQTQRINLLTVEHLFCDDDLIAANCFGGYEDIGVGVKIIKIGKKKNFWKKVLVLPKESFKSFGVLFDRIESLIGP